MTKSVAKMGDVIATPGTIMLSPAVGGSWSAAPVTYTIIRKVAIGGVGALHQAECTFTFTGADPMGVPVVGAETVTLVAGSTKLTGSTQAVLVDGDQKEGIYKNKLVVNTGNKLTSAS